MRVGLYINFLGRGGAERVVSRISQLLYEEGIEVYTILSDSSNPAYCLEGTVLDMGLGNTSSMPGKVYTFLARIRRLKDIKRSLRLDCVISFLDGANIVNIIARNPGTRCLVSVRNYLKAAGNGTIYKTLNEFLIKMLYNNADKVVAVSNDLARSMVDDFGVDEGKVAALYNPFDIGEIERLGSAAVPARLSGFLSKHERIIATIGRLEHQKGYWNLIKAFGLIGVDPSSTGKFGLLFIGEGRQRWALERLAHETGVSEHIFFAGNIENPFPLLKASDVYVQTSLFEGFPNALVEAMACGLPVVATDCHSGPKEILCLEPDLSREEESVKHGDFGILVPCFNQEEDWRAGMIEDRHRMLAEAIMQALSPVDEEMWSAKAFKRAHDFSYGIFKEKFIKMLRDV